MERQYYKKFYSKFWIDQTKKYGYGVYEQNLVKLILRLRPEKVFEVGIGTGWPIGTALKEKGVQIDGCDIAPNLVELAQEQLDNEFGIWTGDVLKYKGDAQYDVTYCVRSSWYIPDFYRTLEKMLSMTKPGGYIIFDAMDKNSLCCLNIRRNVVCRRFFQMFFRGSDVNDYGHHFISMREMKDFLKKKGLRYRFWKERCITQSKDVFHTPKVVFYCQKER